MIDFANLTEYRENNRIEAKKALGGLPHSIWETYSAFANTLGGIILLGVEEGKDKSLHAVDLPDPEGLIRRFWEMVNDPNKASVNVLTRKNVSVQEIGGNHIVVIAVPRAQRYDRPVFVEGNPLSGTYRRNGEGDYRCTREEILAMSRDASVRTQDMLVLEDTDTDVFLPETVSAYRKRMREARPGHIWESLDDPEFLVNLNAVGRGADGRLHPTAAGLLMFGRESEILREYPSYSLVFRDELPDRADTPPEPAAFCPGIRGGNVCDFYFRTYERLIRGLPPVPAGGSGRPTAAAVRAALREALVNCLANADYYGPQGVFIVRSPESLVFSNPGGFRVEIGAARSGGVSDPRNGALHRMFCLIDAGRHSGSGIPFLCNIWRGCGLAEPVITEQFSPERTVLTLPLRGVLPASTETDRGPGMNGGQAAIRNSAHRMAVIAYLTDHISAGSAELGALTGLSPSRVRSLLRQLAAEGVITAQGSGRGRTYRLKA